MSLLEDFELALDEIGVKHRRSGVSLVAQDCPACGSNEFKVHFRAEEDKEVLFGRCYAGRCQENYSSFKYLLLSDLEYDEVCRIHGRDPVRALGGLSPDVDELLGMVSKEPARPSLPDPTQESEICDISSFFKLADWPEHPASQYAISRGARPEHESVMIDPETNAVVFIVRDDRKLAGYQKRFVNPVSPHLKTKSSFGFEKTKNILQFPRDGAKILICEGPFTAIAAWHFGYHAICTFGSAVSEEQIKIVVELAEKLKQPVGVAFDLDEAGRKGFARVRSGLFWKDKEIFMVKVTGDDLKVGYDLSDAFRDGRKVEEITTKWGGPAVPEIPEFV